MPFSLENSAALSGYSTWQRISWRGADDLAAIVGRKVRVRIHLRQGEPYAFWVSPDARGASLGWVAGGGPEFDGPTETVGSGSLLKP